MTFCDFSKKFRAFLALGAVLTSAVVAVAANSQSSQRSGLWAHETSALKPDPNVVWGRLDNGLRYALLPHRGVPGRVSSQMIVLTGSVDELDDERGIAHFMEHMVFRTSTHFTLDEKLEFFRKLGMEFGSDVSATTTHEYTNFSLEFHDATPELLSQGFRIYRDFADGAKFIPAEIDKERGVVLSEMRDRGGLMSTTMDDSAPVLFKGLRYVDRAPIGTEATLRSFTREHFVRFYQRCYRPDLMVLVAAGDFDPSAVVKLLQERFGDMPKPTTPPPVRDIGRLDMTRGLRAGVLKISGVGGAQAVVACTSPDEGKPDSIEARLERLRREIAMDIVSERLQAEAGPGSGANYAVLFSTKFAELEARISPENWAHDLGVLDDLVRFTAQKGFEQREFDVVKRRYATRVDYMLDQKDTLDPTVLMNGLKDSIIEHEVFTGFEADFRFAKDALARTTLRDLLTAFQSMWDIERMSFHISGEVDIEGGGAEVLKKIQADRRAGLRHFRPETRKEAVFELKKWGPPTDVVESKEVPELGAKLLRFGNNVRVNFVRNRSNAGLVHVVARVGAGLLDMPDNRPALKEFGLRSVVGSGSGSYTAEQIQALVEDHMAYFSFDIQDQDAFAFRAGVTTEKIDECLGIITDFLCRPLFGTAAHREEKMKAFIARGMSSMGIQEGMRELSNHLYRGDARLTWGGPNDYIGLSAVDVRNWLEDPLKRGYLEVTIVGDISEEAMLASVKRTIGSLPPRAETKTLFTTPKPIKVTAPAGFERIEFVGEQHLALVTGSWPVQGKLVSRDRIALQVVARALRDRFFDRIRSDLGLAYSPSADIDFFNGFPDFAIVQAFVECAPSDSSRIAQLVAEIGADLASKGISESEFMGARGILRSQIQSSFRDGPFLLKVLSRSQEKPESVATVIALKQGLIEEVTLADINQWATKILARPNCRTAALVPKPFIGIFQTDKP